MVDLLSMMFFSFSGKRGNENKLQKNAVKKIR